MGAHMLPDAPSANVIGELRGREKPDEVVVIGGHIDSWDVGQGAHDDGAGIVTMMHALTTIRSLGLQPRRTIRVVLLHQRGERPGAAGTATPTRTRPSSTKHVARDRVRHAAASRRSASPPTSTTRRATPRAPSSPTSLSMLDADRRDARRAGGSGADIGPMASPAACPRSASTVDGSRYFDYHHTAADTLDKVDPADLADDVAAVATVAFILADMDGTLPRGPGRPRQFP